ncbi:metallopeptidase M24 family protein [Candidatus Endolissoclinum faulkneri L2]|uniref:Metallopeptidase M24 family protein n=1 Tax=Candidatus Endolissoclinum faulkneri L2 TaxID=1193729 RepID=K7Z551_9PROT|nr:aminopeptidase P family protein [Candidatus Endolissoclinum faulkneri]AFX99178.1 metallopeptidase M24 family protein [Candidatus Endolissoclinum faulkneri L2]
MKIPSYISSLSSSLRVIGIEISERELTKILTRIAISPRTYPTHAWHKLIFTSKLPNILADNLDYAVETLRQNTYEVELQSNASRLASLRSALEKIGVNGFILPRADEHMGESIPSSAERVSWLTGFTGSAAVLLVLSDVAVIFVDGRYTTQVVQQVDIDLWTVENFSLKNLTNYLRKHLAGRSLGFDPKLHSINTIHQLTIAVHDAGGIILSLEINPIDELWINQPPTSLSPVELLPVKLTGMETTVKQKLVASKLEHYKVDAMVLNQSESIAWLLNLRGADVAYTPLPLAYAIINRTAQVALFLEKSKCRGCLQNILDNKISLYPFEDIGSAIDTLGANNKTVAIDPNFSTEWMRRRLENAGAVIFLASDPCIMLKACKNAIELANTRNAHIHDGVAVTRFLKWVEDNANNTTELDAIEVLEAFRSEISNWRGPSFPPISASGSNAAIVHYQVTSKTNRQLDNDNLYLIDSGGQFSDGTTDITRTVAIGTPNQEMKERFTLVLKGHIAIASARFPVGTNGGQLDALARQFLWKAGLDFDHATGHGVGVFLGVHEGPQRIAISNNVSIEAGMILSNEPGYYKPGAYGIRIENLMITVPVPLQNDQITDMLGFEIITFAPIDRRLIEISLMTKEEISWFDSYHAKVREKILPNLDSNHQHWLKLATAPLIVSIIAWFFIGFSN